MSSPIGPKLRSLEGYGRVFVWRKSTKEWLNCCRLGSVKAGEASVMVWGSKSFAGAGLLTVVEGTITGETYNQTQQKHFLPLIVSRRAGKKDTMLQDDNAPAHRANLVKTWRKKTNLKWMEWPAQCSDLNPIWIT